MDQVAPQPHQPEVIFHSAVSDAFLKDLMRVVFKGYEQAAKKCSAEFDNAEYHDLNRRLDPCGAGARSTRCRQAARLQRRDHDEPRP